jgi:hypothetical protein
MDELELGESGFISGDWIVALCEVFACCFAGERTTYSVTAVPTITTTDRPTAASTEGQGNGEAASWAGETIGVYAAGGSGVGGERIEGRGGGLGDERRGGGETNDEGGTLLISGAARGAAGSSGACSSRSCRS